MCGQLHHTTPGSGVFSHQWAQLPPIKRLTSLSSARELDRLLVLEALGSVGVDVAEAEHRGQRCRRRR